MIISDEITDKIRILLQKEIKEHGTFRKEATNIDLNDITDIKVLPKQMTIQDNNYLTFTGSCQVKEGNRIRPMVFDGKAKIELEEVYKIILDKNPLSFRV